MTMQAQDILRNCVATRRLACLLRMIRHRRGEAARNEHAVAVVRHYRRGGAALNVRAGAVEHEPPKRLLEGGLVDGAHQFLSWDHKTAGWRGGSMSWGR